MVLAPEHELVDALVAGGLAGRARRTAWTGGHATPAEAVAAYRAFAAARDRGRAARPSAKEKTGVFIGAYATNPVNGAQIPIFIADYVLAGYGTGAIMAVPGQDERDWEFAEVFDLPIVRTVQPAEGFDGKAYTGRRAGHQHASPAGLSLDGLGVAEAKATIIDWLEEHGHGAGRGDLPAAGLAVQPAAVLGRAVPDRLRRDRAADRAARVDAAAGAARGRRLLAEDVRPGRRRHRRRRRRCRGPREWVEVELDLGDGPKRYTRETNTMPQWAGSCWYELRYLDPTNDERVRRPGQRARTGWARSPPATAAASTCTSAASSTPCCTCCTPGSGTRCCSTWATSASFEPFRRLFNQGYIQAYAYTDARGVYVPAEEVVERDGALLPGRRAEVNREYGKMGKSLKNVVTPGRHVRRLRRGHVPGVRDVDGPAGRVPAVGDPGGRRLVPVPAAGLAAGGRRADRRARGSSTPPADDETHRLLHRTIDGVRADMEGLRFNTAIAKLIELTNRATAVAAGGTPREAGRAAGADGGAVRPAPRRGAVAAAGPRRRRWPTRTFPVADPALLVAESVTYPVQVNGKVRGRIEVAADAAEDDGAGGGAGRGGRGAGRPGAPKKVIVVPGRMVSVVV